jgi:hypothetical protein
MLRTPPRLPHDYNPSETFKVHLNTLQTTEMTEGTQSKRFEPKVPVQLDPPKDDLISTEELAKCDGKRTPRSRLARERERRTHASLQVPIPVAQHWLRSRELCLMCHATQPTDLLVNTRVSDQVVRE